MEKDKHICKKCFCYGCDASDMCENCQCCNTEHDNFKQEECELYQERLEIMNDIRKDFMR